MKDLDQLNNMYDIINDLIDEVELYDRQIEAEKRDNPDNINLQRLLGLQQKRIQWLTEYLTNDGDELMRDLMDRAHVIQEAREGRFN